MSTASPPSPSRSRFADVLTARTIRAVERDGPLDDAQAIRDAARRATGHEPRVVERARILAERIGVAEDMRRLAARIPLVTLAVALVVMLLTWALLTAVVSDGRRINVVAAFFGVLGPHLLSLAVWLVALVAPASSGIAGALGRGLAGASMRLATSLGIGGRHGAQIVAEGTDMLREHRLMPWAFGLVNHGIWAAAFTLLLPALIFLFAFRSYALGWETTILSRDFFVDFIAVANRLPAALHLPVVDTSLLATADAAAAHRALALWLAGCVLVYGWLPRVVLFALSWVVWRRRRSSFRLDPLDAYFRRLFNRFDELGQTTVVDAEQRGDDKVSRSRRVVSDATGVPLWLGFELPPETRWPVHPPTAGRIDERIAGDSGERRRVIDRLASEPPSRVVVVCDGAATPDRGTARFLGDVLAHTGAVALLLVAPGGREVHADRWREWCRSSGFADLPVFTEAVDAGEWTSAHAHQG